MLAREFCDLHWVASQLSIYERFIACIPVVFSYFEFPWSMMTFLASPPHLLYDCIFYDHSLVLAKYLHLHYPILKLHD